MIDEKLSLLITDKYKEISQTFGEFQNKSHLPCPEGCGKCCLNPEISCAPYELLPLAFSVLKSGEAELLLEEAKKKKNERCLLLEVTDEEKGLGRCRQYDFRPFICRAFGVSARHGKNDKIDYSICSVLKNNDQSSAVLQLSEAEIPFIEVWKKRFESIDPKLLEKEIPLNQALIIILEKVLLWDSYREK